MGCMWGGGDGEWGNGEGEMGRGATGGRDRDGKTGRGRSSGKGREWGGGDVEVRLGGGNGEEDGVNG